MALPTLEILTSQPFWVTFDHEILTGSVAPPRSVPMYYDRLDRMYGHEFRQDTADQGSGYFDPILFDATSPMSVVIGEPSWIFLASPGEWDRLANTQKIYGGSISTNQISEAHPLTTVVEVADPYPNVGFTTTRNGKASSEDGYYSGSNSSFLFFETLGYVLCTNCLQVRYSGITYSNIPVTIDLSTGDATPVDGMFFHHQASPNAWQGEEVFGDSFTCDRAQFVPDDDSTPAAPKGFIFAHARVRLPVGGDAHQYCKFYDWNPTGKPAEPGTLSRVHKRLTMLSRFEIDEAAYPTGIDKNYAGEHIIYHPPSRGLIMYIGNWSGVGDPPTADELKVTFGVNATLADITAPAQLRDVETAKTIPFYVYAYGTLGEPIAGVDVTFSIERVSTIGEVLDTSGGAGSDSQVDNSPIDDDPEFPVVVYKDGVPLVDPTHYSVDRGVSPNEIDFVAPEPDGVAVYTVDYPHRTDPATPAHGTLLTATSQTDADGEALTDVRYADDDDLVGDLDKLTATTS
jgi:hypothetical protein